MEGVYKIIRDLKYCWKLYLAISRNLLLSIFSIFLYKLVKIYLSFFIKCKRNSSCQKFKAAIYCRHWPIIHSLIMRNQKHHFNHINNISCNSKARLKDQCLKNNVVPASLSFIKLSTCVSILFPILKSCFRSSGNCNY